LNTISGIEQIATLDVTNVNPNFSNTNPNYQKNNSSATFTKKKYDFSDEKNFRKEDKGNKPNLMRNFENKPQYLSHNIEKTRNQFSKRLITWQK